MSIYHFLGIVRIILNNEFWLSKKNIMFDQDFTEKKQLVLTNNCPLLPFHACSKKDKSCCKRHKKGDRCKKCPGRK
jgi:hypothetical protein